METTEQKAITTAHITDPEYFKHKYNLLKEKVLEKRPVLKKILEKKGDKKLSEYVQDYVDINLNPTIPLRQHEMLNVIKETLMERFGSSVAIGVINQLKNRYFVSTADHTGPINHPFFVNSNLLIASSLINHPDPSVKYNIVLGCANISIDNHTFPRGLFFHTYKNNILALNKFAFFSSKVTPTSVYALPAYKKENIEKIYAELKKLKQKEEISNEIYDKLFDLFREVYDQEDILNSRSYFEQISKTNLLLWRKMFSKNTVPLPDLIYLELEDIVVKLITRYHLHTDTIINHILFDEEYEHYINTYFENIFGSFSRKNSSGTYLFWALPPGAKDKMQLWREGNFLVSKDGKYKIELDPEIIKRAMESKELIPGLLLDFVVLSFYYGLKCLGGFNQVNYLTSMKNGYIKMNVDLENYRSIEVCARAQTKEICDGPTIAFLGYNDHQNTLISGLDLYLYHDEKTVKSLMDSFKNITLSEAISPLLPEIYRITYDQSEWDMSLNNITEKDITKFTGLDKKIKPCAYIPK